ncbi:MAG: hypothetical protein JSS15_11485 [Proteobacteria bacterium]|nr:hypothetical protein [Pseudomonadota bacterium]
MRGGQHGLARRCDPPATKVADGATKPARHYSTNLDIRATKTVGASAAS